ncbi:MAG: hypothetical protein JSW10_07010 [Pseudomonadota bacterium]|nr:MAG: hypothetical protein JSW10_07010 [Pseudomonadota bacterium]
MADSSLRLRVECYAGYRGEEAPRRFYLGDREIEVTEVLDRWQGLEHRYFKVRGDDGGIYILRHDTESQAWDLTMYDSGKVDDIRLSST